MKYVIYDAGGFEIPIIFPDIINHSDFAHYQPVSAGYCYVYGANEPLPDACCVENALRISVSGESTSLGLKTRPEDEAILAKELMRHYH